MLKKMYKKLKRNEINIHVTHDISPKGANASRSVCVSISGLRSPTNM
jgi:hypothetical protein